MSLFKNYTLDVYRYTGGSYDPDSGKYIEGSESTFQILTSLQPINGEELQALPEARRQAATYKIYPEVVDPINLPLRTVDDENPDQIDVFGERYEIYRLENWTNDLINHQKAYLGKKTNP
jgi:hypothetical protein